MGMDKAETIDIKEDICMTEHLAENKSSIGNKQLREHTKERKYSNMHLPISFSDVFLILGEFLIGLLTFTMVLPSIGIFMNITINPVFLMLAIACSLGMCIILNRNRLFEVAIALISGIIIVILCCFICIQIYDMLCDSTMYHKLAVHALTNGWNPFNGSIENWQQTYEVFEPTGAIWIDHYPKGIYFIASCLSASFGDLEAGKAYTLIAMIGCASLLGSVLYKQLVSVFPAIVIAVLTTVNPITGTQMLTFYNDAFLMLMILVLLIGLVLFIIEDRRGTTTLAMVLIACGFILCAETKFTGFAYAGLFSLAFYIFYLTRTLTSGYGYRKLVMLSILFAVVIIASFVVLGYTSYITNTIDHGNPFYPLMGEGAVDIFTKNAPRGYDKMNNLERLFFSWFSVSQNTFKFTHPVDTSMLKIPFTFSFEEFEKFTMADMRMGGYGPLYSGILIVQVILIAFTLPCVYRTHKTLIAAFACYTIVTLALLIGISDSWWARYSAYQYFLNTFALIFIFLYFNQSKGARRTISGILASIFSILLLINSAGIIFINVSDAIDSNYILNMHLDNMRNALDDGHSIIVDIEEDMPGMLYILSNNGINFILGDSTDNEGNIIDYDWMVRYFKYKIID